MKLRPRTFRIQWDVHAWVGVTASLLTFVIFFFGVFALFLHDIVMWEDCFLRDVSQSEKGRAKDRGAFFTSGEPPTLQRTGASAGDVSFDRVLSAAGQVVDVPSGGYVGFQPHEQTSAITVYVIDRATDEDTTVWVDPHRGTAALDESRLGYELYALHFFYQLPGGLQLAGVVAVAFLVLMIGGLVLHLKDLRRQLWQFRSQSALRFSSSDAHKVLGVFGLPFGLVLAWSGALLCLNGVLAEVISKTHFDDDLERVQLLRGETQVNRRPAGKLQSSLPLDELVDRARHAADTRDEPSYFDMQPYGDASAVARAFFPERPFGTKRFVVLDATTGETLANSEERSTATSNFEQFLFHLHFAEYGGRFVSLLYALLALGMCAVIITGNVVWLERRDPARAHLGNRVLERLTIGVTTGAVLGAACYFLANKLLPQGLDQRADWEVSVLWTSWAITVLTALGSGSSPRRICATTSVFAALAFASAAAFDLGDALLAQTSFDGVFGQSLLAVDTLLLVLGLGCLGFAYAVREGQGLETTAALVDEPGKPARVTSAAS